MDLISIIVPVYNVEEYLDRCVNSLVCQTYKELEIILVDDGSTDGSKAICDEWQKRDPRIKVIHQKNQGLSGARNTGIRYAVGEYLSFVDSDDYVEPYMIQELYKALEKFDVPMAICGYYDVFPQRIVKHTYTAKKVIEPRDFFLSVFENLSIGSFAWNKLYHKTLFDNVRFPEGRKFEDINTVYKLICQCNNIAVVDRCLYFYVHRRNSITATADETGYRDQLLALEERANYICTYYPELERRAKSQLIRMKISAWNALASREKAADGALEKSLHKEMQNNLKHALYMVKGKYKIMAVLIAICPTPYKKLLRMLKRET